MMSSGSEEARKIKQRIHECNEASQDQWSGIQSSTHIPIPNHGWASSTDAKNSCTFFHEWAIQEASKAIRLWISYWIYYDRSVVPMEKPLGKMEIEAMIQAAVEQTNTGGNWDSSIFADIQM